MNEGVDRISVDVPLDEKYGHLLRLAVSGIGLRMDYTYDDIEDLKLAVDEAYLLAIREGSRQERASVEFLVHEDRMEILFHGLQANSLPEQSPDLESFGLFLIKGVMDEVNFAADDGADVLRMTKFLKK